MKRRTFLKQTTIATAGVSGLSMQPLEAKDTTKAKTKYLFVVEGNGLPQRQIHPKNVPFIPLDKRDAHQEFKLTELPMSLEPVAEYMNQMCIVQGVSGRICGGGHSNDHGTLGSYNARDGKLIAGPTIDYLIGSKRDRIFDNIVLGINGNNRDIVFNLSAADVEKPIATICNPVAAYNRIFGALGNEEAIEEDEKIIQYLKKDIEKTKKQLGDDLKLKKYGQALDSIVQRNAAIRNAKVGQIPNISEKYHSQDHVEMVDAHFEIATSALQNDLTDSATIAVGVGYTHFQINMTSLEGVTSPRHGLGHANMGDFNPSIQSNSHHEAALVRRYLFSLITRTLKSVENLVVVYCSDAAEKHHSQCYEWPHILIGNSTDMRLDGRFIYYPKEGVKGHKTINALHNTILRSAGIHYDGFGQFSKGISPQAQNGILEEIYS